MPFDQRAAVAVAADAARLFTEGLRGLAAKAAEEVDAESQKLEEERKKLQEEHKALEAARKRLEADVQGLAEERQRLAADQSALEGERTGLEKDRAGLDELRRSFNNDRNGLNRDRAVLAQERAMFEKQQAELSKAREEFCKERVDFEEAKELSAKKQVSPMSAGLGAEESSEMVALNLGGEANVTVFLQTLLQCPESRFANTFSRPRELPRDAEGRIFVDFKPALFMPLLEHLRMRRIEEPSDPTPAPQFDSPELEGQFNKMLQHYGLKDWIYRTAVPSQPKPEGRNLVDGGAKQSGPHQAGLQLAPLPAAAATRQLPPTPAVGARLQDAAQKVLTAEAKVQETLRAAAPLAGEGAEACEVETLKVASERTMEAEKIAAIACAEAKKILTAKQKDEQAAKEVAGYQADVLKLQERLAAAQQELSKQRKVAVQGERLWKGKLALRAEEAKVRELEAQVQGAVAGGAASARAAAQAALAAARSALQAAGQSGEAQAQGYLAKLLARVDRCQERLSSLTRPKASAQEEVAQVLSKAEQAVKQAVLAARPLSAPGGEELSPEKAQEICESVGKAEQEAAVRVEEARSMLFEKQKQGWAMNPFLARVNGMKGELAKAKADASNYEQKLVAKMIRQEVEEAIGNLESQVEKVREAVEVMVEERGKCFVVSGMARMIAEALDEYRQTNGTTRDAVFLRLGPGASRGKVTEREFSQFLGQVPAMCSRPNLAFSPEQRTAIFNQLDKDKDGTISKADFNAMFCDRYICVKEIILTAQLQVTSGAIGKLQVNDIVELVDDMQSDAATGLVRAQVTLLKTGAKGWVTIRTNAGTTLLSALTPYQDYMRDLEQLTSSVPIAVSKALECLNSKIADIQDCNQGQIVQVKAALGKLKPKIGAAQAKFARLKKKIEEFQHDYAKRDAFERRKSAENLERKASTLSNAASAEPT